MDEEHEDPRVTRTRAAVTAAVRHLVGQAGIEAVTHAEVARAADVGRATVYRHWPDRTRLLLDAYAHEFDAPAEGGGHVDGPDRPQRGDEEVCTNDEVGHIDVAGRADGPLQATGHVQSELRRDLDRVVHLLAQPVFVRALLGLVGRSEWEPRLRDLKHELVAQGTSRLRRTVEEAITAGELPSNLDVDAAIMRLVGPLFFRRVLADQPIDDVFVAVHLEAFMAGVAMH